MLTLCWENRPSLSRRLENNLYTKQTKKVKRQHQTRKGMILPFLLGTAFDADPYNFNGYDARAKGACAALNMFSMKIPYPVVGSLIITCVTAPTGLPF